MKIRADVTFEDAGEAARWLAGYCSPVYDHPGLAQDHQQEFPLAERLSCPINSQEIARQATLVLYERFCTDEGREAARLTVCGPRKAEG